VNQYRYTQCNYEVFLQDIVSKLGTIFTSPEENLTVQGKKAKHMFIMVSGECIILVKDIMTNNQNRKANLLVKSDHFGEISCLFNCPRTATVIGMNYNIMATLSKPSFKQLTSDYPELKLQLLRNIYRLKDSYKDFMYNIFYRIQFFRDLKVDLFHQMIYSFKEKNYAKGESVFNVDDPADYISIVQSGIVEIFVTIDSTEFVLEELKRGSIINHTNFFFDNSQFYVNARCS
jgi:CRP-like cAMP-binding protein